MNSRRDFLSKLGASLLGFTILPPALTYERVWKAERKIAVSNCPFWNEDNIELYNKLPYFFAVTSRNDGFSGFSHWPIILNGYVHDTIEIKL